MSETPDQEIQTLQSIFWSKRDPDGLAFAPLAQAHLRRGEIRQALDLLTDGTSRHPDYATGHVIATRLYFDQGMFAEAEFAARRVLELDPENIVGLSILVAVLRGRRDQEADSILARLIDVDPESEEARWATTAAAADVDAGDDEDFFGDPWDEPAAADDDRAGDQAGADVLAVLTLREDLDDDGIMELGTLAPDEAVMDLGTLAPDEVTTDLGALAPDEVTMDLGTLAPDEVAMDLGALAPDDDPTVDPEALRPDPGPAPDAVDLGDLAPDAIAMDLDALAPDTTNGDDMEAEPMDLEALAPDGPDAADTDDSDDSESDAMDLSALAPDTPVEDDEAMDLAMLAPDDADDDDADDSEAGAMDLAALAPDDDDDDDAAAADDADAMDLSALAPDTDDAHDSEADAMDLATLAPDAHPREDNMSTSEPVRTRTLAELYVKQGFVDQAVSVYRQLLVTEPDAEDVRARLAELEGGAASPDKAAKKGPPPTEEEVETLARDLAESGVSGHDVDTPFAWMDEPEAASDDSPGIRDYFDALLSRDRGDS